MDNITPLEYVLKEYPEFNPSMDDLDNETWLRKMQEFAFIQNNKNISIDKILSLGAKEKAALLEVVSTLSLRDNSDYQTALYSVVHHLAEIEYDQLTDTAISAIWNLLK